MPLNRSDSIGMPRRDFLRLAGAAAVGAGLPHLTMAEEAAPVTPASFRIAHLTDIHVQQERKAAEGLRKCLAAVHELKPRPDLILTGGDLVMDSLAAVESRVKTLWDLYTSACKDSDIPIKNCIGNHDVLGWSSKSTVPKDHPLHGKKMVQDRLELPRTTYSFDFKGWHICMVDDILPKEGESGYEAGITEEDLAWLDADLKAAKKKPKLLVAHIPIVSVVVYQGMDGVKLPDVEHLQSMVCKNPQPILKLLRQHKVQLVLGGHLHDNEVLRYEHTTHVGEGAVCGAWWKGSHRLSPEGFGVIDLHADGRFEHQYHTYGWKAQPEA